MNILYTITSLGLGGAERLVVDMINNLPCKEGDSIYLCIINKTYDEKLINEINPKVKILYLNRQEHTGRFKYFFEYTKFVLKNKIDVIHCQCSKTVEFALPSKILRPHIKIIHTVHDTNVYNNLNSVDVLVDKLFTHKIIAISDSVKNDILSRNIKESKVERVYNAINTKKFSSKKFVKEDRKQIVIGNVARILPEKKGQDILIRAIAEIKDKYPDIRCMFAGSPSNGRIYFKEELEEIARDTGVKDNIEFVGDITDVPSFLDNLDIFVLPSRYEGFGISLIEAMSMGLPCISSDIEGPKEIIKENKYGILFKTGDYKDLADKLDNVIQKLSNYNKEEVINYVHKNFDIKNMMKKVYGLYC